MQSNYNIFIPDLMTKLAKDTPKMFENMQTAFLVVIYVHNFPSN